MSFGQRLKELRLENGLTQLQLAEMLDVSKSNISKYEAGSVEPNLDIITKISIQFNVTTDYLLGRNNYRLDEFESIWQYPHEENRLGEILSKYRKNQKLSISDFAQKIGISESLAIQLEQGICIPSMSLIKEISNTTGYDIDYIIGATDRTSIPLDKTFKSDNIKAYLFELDTHFRSRFRELCNRHNIDKENAMNYLQISSENFFDIYWNRMPTLSELLRIAYAFDISMDYLIGKTDTPFSGLSKDELELILNYRDCIEPYKQNIRERAEKLSVESAKDSSVVTDEPLRKTGTTGSLVK